MMPRRPPPAPLPCPPPFWLHLSLSLHLPLPTDSLVPHDLPSIHTSSPTLIPPPITPPSLNSILHPFPLPISLFPLPISSLWRAPLYTLPYPSHGNCFPFHVTPIRSTLYLYPLPMHIPITIILKLHLPNMHTLPTSLTFMPTVLAPGTYTLHSTL